MTTELWRAGTARRLGCSAEALGVTKTRVAMTLHVPCKGCKTKVDFPVQPNLHPDGIAKRMLAAGWTVGSSIKCPACTNKAAERKVRTMATSADQGATQSDAAKRAHRLVMQALEDFYDEAAKRYRPGHSDQSIADETGASPAYVAKVREDYFGPLGEPPEIVEMRKAVALMQSGVEKTFTEMRQQVATLQAKIARICQVNNWPVD